jgi:CheY-like chemotaxis protein
MPQDAAVVDAASQSSTNTESPNAMSNRTAPHEARVTTLDEIIPNTRILVVDDDDLLRGIVEAILIDAGDGTGGANDGEEALIMLATDHFDLVTANAATGRLRLVRALRAVAMCTPVRTVSGSLAVTANCLADLRRRGHRGAAETHNA